MRLKWKLIFLGIACTILVAIFLFSGVPGNWEYILPRRISRVLAIIVTGSTIAIATVVFQTITNNRILTPSVIGLDSLYLLLQTFFIFVFGSTSIFVADPNINFIISVLTMILFALLLYKFLFKKQKNVYFLLLVGIILGTFFGSISTFMQVLIDPNEFMTVQNKMFASFNNVNTDILWFAIIMIIGTLIYFFRYIKFLDVMSLGKEHAINLGIDYDHVVQRLLIIIAIWISIATALVGPILFLGLLVANIAYEFMKTYKHSYLLVSASLISILAIVGGQLVVERVFSFETTLSVIINFIGGVYFLYLILKENTTW